MTWRVRVRPSAELSLLAAARWYEAQRQGLGAAFSEELAQVLAWLADNALIYPELFRGVRRVFAHRFPYIVYYRIAGDDVMVLAILHMRRRRSF